MFIRACASPNAFSGNLALIGRSVANPGKPVKNN
jgi:hypothetical protein